MNISEVREWKLGVLKSLVSLNATQSMLDAKDIAEYEAYIDREIERQREIYNAWWNYQPQEPQP